MLAAPSMSHFLNQTSKAVLDKYKGDLDNLRNKAKHNPAKERELVKEFKVTSPCKTVKEYTYTASNRDMFLHTFLYLHMSIPVPGITWSKVLLHCQGSYCHCLPNLLQACCRAPLYTRMTPIQYVITGAACQAADCTLLWPCLKLCHAPVHVWVGCTSAIY